MTRMLLTGASVLALVYPSAALAAASGDERDANSQGNGTITGNLNGVGTRATTCDEAKDKLAKAKRKLKKLKQNDAPSQAIHKAKKRVKKARDAVDEACGSEVTVFDISALSGSFDATLKRQEQGSSCAITKDAHWTASLAPGAGPATLDVDDVHGLYFFSSPPGGIPVIQQGSGVATRTCDEPAPGPSGSTSCSFQAVRGVTEEVNGAYRDPMTLNWYFGYPRVAYNPGSTDATCSFSGPRPPTLLGFEASPGLFVAPGNDGSDPLAPVGISTVPVSIFGEDVTLNFSGSFSGSSSASFDGGSLEASWQLTVALRRR
jgi:hypothetical protein